MKNVLLTGGTGYIGSHTAVALVDAGFKPVLIDNLSNSDVSVVAALSEICGVEIPFIHANILDTSALFQVLIAHEINAVIHFAGLKAVGESVDEPLAYYKNNVQGTLSLIQAMQQANVKSLVFSSSATVYGEPQYLPLDENHPLCAMNPYGRTKIHIEEILRDCCFADKDLKVISLRYFNPVGAHDSGLIGEAPSGIPNNLMPYLTAVASGRFNELKIFGADYPTQDGTGVRDYIHVMDLAEGHVAALCKLNEISGWEVINLGTGKGVSVRNLIKIFEQVNDLTVPCSVVQRRSGDIATCYADVKKAKQILAWEAKRSLSEMCRSAWIYQEQVKEAFV